MFRRPKRVAIDLEEVMAVEKARQEADRARMASRVLDELIVRIRYHSRMEFAFVDDETADDANRLFVASVNLKAFKGTASASTSFAIEAYPTTLDGCFSIMVLAADKHTFVSFIDVSTADDRNYISAAFKVYDQIV